MIEDEFAVLDAKQRFVGDVYESVRIVSEDDDASGRIFKMRGLPGVIARLRRTVAGR